MIKSKKIYGMLILLLVSFFCVAQCPDSLVVNEVIDQKDSIKLEELVIDLTNCSALQLSLAEVHHQLGIKHFNQDIFYKAISSTQKSIDIKQQHLDTDINKDLARSYFNLGLFKRNANDLDGAKGAFQRNYEIYDTLGNLAKWDALKNTAEIESTLGQTEKATILYQSIFQSLQKSDDYKNVLCQAAIEFGDLLRIKKEYKRAIQVFSIVEPFLEEVSWRDEATLYLNKGLVFFEIGMYENAIVLFMKSSDIYKEIELDYLNAKALNNIAVAQRRLKQLSSSEQTLQEAITICEANDYKEILAQSYNNLAEVYLDQKDIQKATRYFKKAITTLSATEEVPKSEAIQYNPHKLDLITYYSDYARALFIENPNANATASLNALRVSDELIAQVTAENIDQVGKLFWRESAMPVYEQAIAICDATNQPDAAYYFFEKSKAVLLLESLQVDEVLQSLPDSLIANKYELATQLASAQSQVDSEGFQGVIQAQTAIEQFNEALITQYPELNQAFQKVEILELERFQKVLNERGLDAGAQFFIGDSVVYALTVRQEVVSLINLGNRKVFESKVAMFLDYFASSSMIDNNPKAFLNVAHQLYQSMIVPLGLENAQKLLLISDGILNYVPFDALLTQSSTTLGTAKYWIEACDIQVDYSFSIYQRHQIKESNRHGNDFVGFAPFAQRKRAGYGQLAYSQDELNAIADKMTFDTFIDEAATKQAFLNACQRAQVLHVSTHAYSTPNESQPHIAFADTLLFLNELYSQPINADLVVLSACQTNIGQHKKGEGVMSLSRGIMQAGANSVISSLWSVNANSTGSLMKNFYEKLEDNTKPTALRNAKLQYLHNAAIPLTQKTPYYWAGFVYLGAEKNIALKKNSWVFYIVFGLAVLGLVSFYYKKNR